MSDVRLVFRPDGIARLADAEETAELLQAEAEKIEARVVAPLHLDTDTRSGVGPHGAYAQVQLIGDGAIAWEFGSRHQPAHAPLRNALRNGRGAR